MFKRLSRLAIAVSAIASVCAAADAQRGQQQQQQQPQLPPDAILAQEIALSPAEAAKQVDLISAALSAVPPQRPGVIDTYVLSVSFWNDPQFEQEAKEAAAILGRRFDAVDRTVFLSAGQSGLEHKFPVATPNNFNAALGKIGATIDPKEDLVVIFMTSHGSPDGSVALMEKNRLSGALRPEPLKAALDQAGIRNKVVIVSACFSGHFVPVFFSDPNAAILTAAAPDRTSFGCQVIGDWTYFGDALFNHALRGARSLSDSYEDALKIITHLEDDLHKEWVNMPPAQKRQTPEPMPSNPQGNVGAQIGPMVEKAEAFGLAVTCAGHLSLAYDRARVGRPLKGLNDAAALLAAKNAYEAKAQKEGALRKRTPQEIGKAFGASASSVLQLFNAQQADVTARAAECLAPPAAG
jgi:hypothetical protein